MDERKLGWLRALPDWPRFPLAHLPTPIQRAANLGRHLNGPELWIKRDDLTGLAGGGNKTRKLEFLVGDALKSGADTLVTVGALQSNHTRQTAAASARASLRCALLHCAWTEDAGPHYRQVGNLLLSSLMGAELYVDATKRPIEDKGALDELGEHLRRQGRRPYVIPGGGSDHRLGSLGYMACAAEIAAQAMSLGIRFDCVVHTTGSSSTQSGLLAGFAALGDGTRVIGISDDDETAIKRDRVLRLANATLEMLRLPERVAESDVEVVVGDAGPYGVADKRTMDAIHLLARTEGLIADPVYEGKAVRGLLDLARSGHFRSDARILLLHLGGTPAVHAYANQFGTIDLKPFPT
ncbi:MAG TPA: D-cysteine desulfhydrase family protein [Dongiaceae bacterium]|jgi:1-aminocyclopropane-1-carboxylate deaminase